MNSLNRRSFLKSGLLASSLVLVAGVLAPLRARAAEWSKSAFESKTFEEALVNLYGSASAEESQAILIDAQFQAENGAVVPIVASSTLTNVESLSILVDQNPLPLVAHVNLSGAQPYLRARMKMNKTSMVRVYVKSNGKLYTASQQIKVTVGGCGG